MTRHRTQPHISHGPTCFHCRQAGQAVLPVTLELEATELTPADLPDRLIVDAWMCIDEDTCSRIAATRRTHPETARLQ